MDTDTHTAQTDPLTMQQAKAIARAISVLIELDDWRFHKNDARLVRIAAQADVAGQCLTKVLISAQVYGESDNARRALNAA